MNDRSMQNDEREPNLRRVAHTIEPSPGLLDAVGRRKRRQETRDRLAAVFVSVASVSAVLALVLFDGGGAGRSTFEVGSPGTQSSDTVLTTPAGEPPDCPKFEVDQIQVSSTAGPSGTKVDFVFPVPIRDQNGDYVAPVGPIEVWWNHGMQDWWELLPGDPAPSPETTGDVTLLASPSATDRCFVEGSFVVPDAAPGTYPLAVILVQENSASPVFTEENAPTFTVK